MFLLQSSHPFIIFLYTQHPKGIVIRLVLHPLHYSILICYHPSHKASPSTPNLHNHLPKRALLKTFKSLTPSSPHRLGVITVSQWTRWNFFAQSIACQRKLLCNLSNFPITMVGALNRDMQHVGLLDKEAFYLLKNIVFLHLRSPLSDSALNKHILPCFMNYNTNSPRLNLKLVNHNMVYITNHINYKLKFKRQHIERFRWQLF